jgi:hypothetical protein
MIEMYSLSDFHHHRILHGSSAEAPLPYSEEIVLNSFGGLSLRRMDEVLEKAMIHLGWSLDGL